MNLKSIMIELVRRGAFSKPHYSIKIHGDGRVIYNGFENVEVIGIVEGKINENDIFKLLNELKNSDFFSLKEDFIVDKTNNQSVVSVSFNYFDENNNFRKKTITHNPNDPKISERLKKFEDAIDEITNSSRWIYKKDFKYSPPAKEKEKRETNKNIFPNKKKYVVTISIILLISILIVVFYNSGVFDFQTDNTKKDDGEDDKNGNNNIIENTTKEYNPDILFVSTTNQSERINNNRSESISVFNKGDTIYVDFEFQNITHNKTYDIVTKITVKMNENEYYSNVDFYYNNESGSDVFYLIFSFNTDESWPSSDYDELYVVNINISDNILNKSIEKDTYFYLLEDKTSKWTDDTFESTILGGNYLINATKNGIFVYNYDPITDTESSSYNILRHAGTIYSMLQLYDITKNNELLDSAEEAIEYLLLFEKPFDDNCTCIVYNDEVKLGGSGLAIIALAEYAKTTGDTKYLSSMQNLAKYIKISQLESGKFISKRYYSSGEIEDWDSEYYPGEAILSLCRLYSLDGNETWLDVAENGSKYLIDLRKNIETNNLVHDHWLMMSLNELYRYRNDLSYFNHAIRLAKSIMNSQRDDVNEILENPGWLGSYYTPPQSTPTATRSEGLIAAYHLSNDFGDERTTERILNSIKLGILFQLQTQFTSDNVVSLSNPQKTIGGFHESLTDYDIRIDYVQHNICSLLGLYKILKE